MHSHYTKHNLIRFALLTTATALLSLTAAFARQQDKNPSAQTAAERAEEERVKKLQQQMLNQMRATKGQMPVAFAFAPIVTDPEGITFGQNPTLLEARVGGAIQAVAFSPDGKVLVGVGGGSEKSGEDKEGFLKLWDATGKERAFLRQPEQIHAVAYSPDGKWLATAEATQPQGSVIRLRDAATGTVRLTFGRNNNYIYKVVFAPGGKELISAGADNRMHVWDVSTGKEKRQLTGHTATVMFLAFAGNGTTLASGSAAVSDSTVRLWDWPSGKERRVIRAPLFNGLRTLSLSPDGKTVLVVGYEQIHLYSTETGKEITPKQKAPNPKGSGGPPYAMPPQANRNFINAAYTPDGKAVAAASADGRLVVLDPKTLAVKGTLDEGAAGPGMIYSAPGYAAPARPSVRVTNSILALSPDGKRMATVSGGDDRLVRVWDVPGRKQLAVLHSLSAANRVKLPIVAMAATRDGKTLALALEDHRIALRDVRSGEVRLLLRGHGDKVTCLAFSPDGKTLASGSADTTAKLWNCVSGKERLTFRGHGNWVYAVAFSPDGNTVASGGYDRLVHVWHADDGRELHIPLRHNAAVRALAFSPDGKQLASGGNDRIIKLWDVATGQERLALKTKTSLRALAFAPRGKLLTSAGDDGSANTWDVASGKMLNTFPGTGGEATAVAFSPTGRRFAVARLDNTVHLWPVARPTGAVVLSGSFDGVTGVAFRPDGRELLTAGYDRNVRLWPATDVPIRLLQGHMGSVSGAVFSPDGKLVLTCSGAPNGDRSLRLWDFATGKEVRRYPTDAQVLAVAFAPDGRSFVAGSMGGDLRIIDVKSGRNLQQFKGAPQAVRCVAFSPDGLRVVSGGDDGAMQVWDVQTDKSVACKGHKGRIYTVGFSPDGWRILSGGDDSTLRVWDAGTGKQLRLLKCDTTAHFSPSPPAGYNPPPSMPGSPPPPSGATKTSAGLPPGKMGPAKPATPVMVGVRSAVILSDGKHAVVTEAEALTVWNLDTGKRVRKITGHRGRIDRIVLARGGKVAVTASQDNTVRLWDVQAGRQLASLAALPVSQAQPTGPMSTVPYGAMPTTPPPPPPATEPEEKKESRKEPPPETKKVDEVADAVVVEGEKKVVVTQGSGPPIMSGVGVAPPSNPDWSLLVAVSPDGQHLLTAGGPSGPATMDNPAYVVRIWRMPEAAHPAHGAAAKP